MRKLLCIMFVLMLCTEALGDVAINETNFPDSYFRNFVRTNFDKDSDGNLSDTEIRSATQIGIGSTVPSNRISSFKGIEYLTSLSYFSCTKNYYITSLDLSSNTMLQTLNCSECRNLTSLNLSNNTMLQTLNCSICKLTSLNLSSSTALKVLNCSNNILSTLDLSKNIALTDIICISNRLSALDISSNTALTSLTCTGNNIPSLDTSNNLVLSTLECGGNHITTLDLSKNIMLKTLNVSGNYLRELDLSNNRNLTILNCSNNFLTALDLTNNILLNSLTCSGNRIPDLDLSKNNKLPTSNITGNQAIPGAAFTDNGDGTFYFDIKTLVDEANLSKISKFTGPYLLQYNSSVGIATFTGSYPQSISYSYNTGRGNISVTVYLDSLADVSPVIATVLLDYGKVGTKYSLALQAIGAASTLWSVTSGTLPAGIGLSPNGTLEGIPTKSGTYEFTVKAENPNGSATKTYTLVIDPDPSSGGDSSGDDSSTSSTPPSITTTYLPEAISGIVYSRKLEADGDSPITWQLITGNLPSGITLSTSGTLSGTTYQTGIFDFTVQASNSAGSVSSSFTLNVIAGDSQTTATPPSITTTYLPDGTTSLAYTAVFAATGTSPITWRITNGEIPGLTLSSSGVLSGTPESAGVYVLTVEASNSAGTDSVTLTLTINDSQAVLAPSITTSTLTAGTVSLDYGYMLKAAGYRPISWALISGDIPGLTVSDSGLLSGVPTEEGTFSFSVQVQNSAGLDSKDLTITINPAPPIMKPEIITDELEPGTVDTEYIFQLMASGTPPITWEIIKGKLPKNLTLSSSGKFSGLLTKAGKKKFTIKASNAYGSDSRIVTLYGYKYPEISTAALKEATAGKSYKATIGMKGTKPFTWSLEGSLPSGLTFDQSKRKISGKPDVIGTFLLRFVLSNPVGDVMRNFTLRVVAELPKISPSKLKEGKVGKSYKTTIKAKGSTPITLSMSGVLPAGLTFNSTTGLLSGTPTEECSNLPIKITASNMGGDVEKLYLLTVKGTAPAITSKKLPDGTVGSSYSTEIAATGSAPLTWSAAGLPGGLRLSDGTISGTPTEAGTFKVEITVSNNMKSVTKKLKLKVAAAGNSASLTHGTIGMFSGEVVSEVCEIVSELGTVSVDESGMHEFGVRLRDDVPVGAKLVWMANSDEPSDDDDIAEFYASDGQEIADVPEDRIITVSAWLNTGRVYNPAIAVRH